MELLGAIIGIIYLILEYRAHPLLWLFGVLMPLAYIYIFFGSHLYANAAINIYYVIISIYGALSWWKMRHADTESMADEGIRSMPRKFWLPIAAIVILLTVALSLLLQQLGESHTAWLDGFTSALSIVGMWMLAKKYYQQWLCWIVVEPVMIAMSLIADLYPTAVMYLVYSVIAILGYRRWKRKESKSESKTQTTP